MRRARPTGERAETDNVGGFAWWAPHDRARHQAEFLLAAVATICAAYLAAAIAAVVIALRVGEVGPWRGIATWQHRLGPFGLAGAAVALVVGAALVIALLAWEGLARRAVRLARARPPAEGEADRALRRVDAFAIGVGIPTPRLHLVDDDAPNAFASGRAGACSVCLTTGALTLSPQDLEALCDHCVASVTNRATPLACAAADLVLVASWCTKALWAVSALVLVSSVVGVPVGLVTMTTLGIVLLVVATKPLLALADQAIMHLLDDTARLDDLETVRVTNRPAALAHLLLTAADDPKTVGSPWQIAHLWFDPDTSRPPTPGWKKSFSSWTSADELSDSVASLRSARAARRMLIDRARVIVALTDGEPGLRAQLAELDESAG